MAAGSGRTKRICKRTCGPMQANCSTQGCGALCSGCGCLSADGLLQARLCEGDEQAAAESPLRKGGGKASTCSSCRPLLPVQVPLQQAHPKGPLQALSHGAIRQTAPQARITIWRQQSTCQRPDQMPHQATSQRSTAQCRRCNCSSHGPSQQQLTSPSARPPPQGRHVLKEGQGARCEGCLAAGGGHHIAVRNNNLRRGAGACSSRGVNRCSCSCTAEKLQATPTC